MNFNERSEIIDNQWLWFEIFKQVLISEGGKSNYVVMAQDVDIIYEAMKRASHANS